MSAAPAPVAAAAPGGPLPPPLAQSLLALGLGGAVYGFAIGAGKNLLYAARSAAKVPLLLAGTALVAALAYHVLARLAGVRLPFALVQRTSLALFSATARLLASLAPASWFLGQTMVRPQGSDLGGYPAFVGTNVLLVAAAGTVALFAQARLLLRGAGLSPRRAAAVVGSWLAVSLLVGGQLAFALRPFFGIASLGGPPPFWLGSEPTATGARNFYEVVWQVVSGRGQLGG